MVAGLGGLDVKDFIDSNGFTESAFMSTTKSLEVALEYSAAKKGNAGAVFAMQISEAAILPMSAAAPIVILGGCLGSW